MSITKYIEFILYFNFIGLKHDTVSLIKQSVCHISMKFFIDKLPYSLEFNIITKRAHWFGWCVSIRLNLHLNNSYKTYVEITDIMIYYCQIYIIIFCIFFLQRRICKSLILQHLNAKPIKSFFIKHSRLNFHILIQVQILFKTILLFNILMYLMFDIL